MKVEQKVSGGFRAPTGTHTFATLRSYIVVARKQGCTALAPLRALSAGQAFLPTVPE